MTMKRAAVAVLLLAVAVLALMPVPEGVSPSVMRGATVALFAMGMWALGALPEPVTAIAFFLLAVAVGVAKPAVIFSGFESQAWWLVFGGIIIGIAVQRTGLALRLSGAIFGRLEGSYTGALAAVATATVALAFLMPSTMGRIVLLMPIALAFADRLGFAPGRPGRTAMALVVCAVSYMPATTILPANVPNNVLVGAAGTLFGIQFNYGAYLLLHFPILGLLKTVMLVLLIARLFPDQPTPAGARAPLPAMSAEERRLTVILAGSIGLFVTDFLHHIPAAWISLAGGLICLLPGVGMVTQKDFAERFGFGPLLYLAGILGLGAVVADSGLGQAIGRLALDILQPEPGRDGFNFTVLVFVFSLIGGVTTMPGLPAVLTPLSPDMASATGIALTSVLMLQVIGFSNIILPYQSPPMMVGFQLGQVRLRDATRLCLWSSAVTYAVLVPLDFLWWRLLGYI